MVAIWGRAFLQSAVTCALRPWVSRVARRSPSEVRSNRSQFGKRAALTLAATLGARSFPTSVAANRKMDGACRPIMPARMPVRTSGMYRAKRSPSAQNTLWAP